MPICNRARATFGPRLTQSFRARGGLPEIAIERVPVGSFRVTLVTPIDEERMAYGSAGKQVLDDLARKVAKDSDTQRWPANR